MSLVNTDGCGRSFGCGLSIRVLRVFRTKKLIFHCYSQCFYFSWPCTERGACARRTGQSIWCASERQRPTSTGTISCITSSTSPPCMANGLILRYKTITVHNLFVWWGMSFLSAIQSAVRYHLKMYGSCAR
jgi:hypothetical protein